MTPSILLQIFKRTGAWLTLRGWAMVGGFVAAGFIICTFILRWH